MELELNSVTKSRNHQIPKSQNILTGKRGSNSRLRLDGFVGHARPSYLPIFFFMSGKRGSNPRPSAWEADALPTELLPRGGTN